MMAVAAASRSQAVSSVPLWYHAMELGGGVETPGWFDLRPIADRMPWPDVRGKRCLDVGTWDGYLAFELERRGASEVVALDIPDHEDWDWPPDVRAQGGERLAELAGPEKGAGFRVAREALGSSVEKVDMTRLRPQPRAGGQLRRGAVRLADAAPARPAARAGGDPQRVHGPVHVLRAGEPGPHACPTRGGRWPG